MSEIEASRWPSEFSVFIYLFIVVIHEEKVTENYLSKKNLRTINSIAIQLVDLRLMKQQPMVDW